MIFQSILYERQGSVYHEQKRSEEFCHQCAAGAASPRIRLGGAVRNQRKGGKGQVRRSLRSLSQDRRNAADCVGERAPQRADRPRLPDRLSSGHGGGGVHLVQSLCGAEIPAGAQSAAGGHARAAGHAGRAAADSPRSAGRFAAERGFGRDSVHAGWKPDGRAVQVSAAEAVRGAVRNAAGHVPGDQRRNRAAVPGRPASGGFGAGRAGESSCRLLERDSGGRLAVSVLQHPAQGRNLRAAEEERQDHEGSHRRGHAAVHAGMDRSLHGGKQPRPPLAGGASRRKSAHEMALFHGRGAAVPRWRRGWPSSARPARPSSRSS